MDLEATFELLENAGLPVSDLGVEMLTLVAEENNNFQGVIGIEAFDDIALLRSLAVSADARGAGMGHRGGGGYYTHTFHKIWKMKGVNHFFSAPPLNIALPVTIY